MCTRRRGVTLVEVVLVAAAVAVLLTVVTPALRAAGGRSRDEVCLSHLRALGAAVRLYSHEHGGTLPGRLHPAASYPADGLTEWQYEFEAQRRLPTLLERVVPDAFDARLIRCPVMAGLVPDAHFERFYELTGRRVAPAHYVLNNYGDEGSGGGGVLNNVRATDPASYFGYPSSYGWEIYSGPRRYGEIPNSDREWMIADGWYRPRVDATFTHLQQEGPYQWSWTGEALPNFAPHGPRAPRCYRFRSSDDRRAEASRIRAAKADGWTNTVYFDGHAAPVVSRTLVASGFELLYGFIGTVNPLEPPTVPMTWR